MMNDVVQIRCPHSDWPREVFRLEQDETPETILVCHLCKGRFSILGRMRVKVRFVDPPELEMNIITYQFIWEERLAFSIPRTESFVHIKDI